MSALPGTSAGRIHRAPASAANTGFGIECSSLAAIRDLCERTPGLARLWIFGSRARGDHRDRSDIDLVADAPKWEMRDSLAFYDALKRLPIVYPIDCTWWQDDGLGDEFREQVERDRRELWAPHRAAAASADWIAPAPGALQLKRFQTEALDALSRYIAELKRYAAQAAVAQQALRAMEGMEDLAREAGDYPKKTWRALHDAGAIPAAFSDRPYNSRFDGADRAIPNVCLKVPTGGGKTLLAAAAVGQVFGSFLERHAGLVLWVVPNDAIYRQTLNALSDRDHPYRQLLNVAGAGRVKVLEKVSPLSRTDIDSHLCVMVLMLQSASRQSKETLRFFRDRGNVLGFLPREDDIEAHWQLLRGVPNLDAYAPFGASSAETSAQKGSIVKSSLGNVMRIVRPMVVIDEGHHAYSHTALATIDGFNPSFMLELSATPRVASAKGGGSNILVDVRGTDLDEAEMIKLPIKVDVRAGDWQGCLGAAVAQLEALQHEADVLRAETARYVRPILLVQVERTGADLRDSGFIHAEDAKAHLMQLGFHERQIAIKTSERNDLAQLENIDLLSPFCDVRAIVTKQALQEGWDCPFAYVLCALAAGRNPAAMTQLVGRILRLPHAAKTGRPSLDACYVLCHDARTGDVVKRIKQSLEDEGMGDLSVAVVGGDDGRDLGAVRLRRRDTFAGVSLFLPRVTWAEVGSPRRDLVYESDVLAHVPWSLVDTDALASEWAPHAAGGRGRFELGLEILDRWSLAAGATTATDGRVGTLDRARIVRSLIDLVPNAWLVREWTDRVLARLLARGFDEAALAASSDSLIEVLRHDLEAERDRLAEATFERLVAEGRIEFRLRADGRDYELPYELTAAVVGKPKPLVRDGAGPIEKSLFVPALRTPDMNDLEEAFAGYLDEQAALRWWHRNVARSQFGLQGWRRHKVYPDFVFGQFRNDGSTRYVLMETKGLHLQGPDTDYKRLLFERLTRAFRDERGARRTGEIELVGGGENAVSVVCDLVFDSAWRGAMAERYFTGEIP